MRAQRATADTRDDPATVGTGWPNNENLSAMRAGPQQHEAVARLFSSLHARSLHIWVSASPDTSVSHLAVSPDSFPMDTEARDILADSSASRTHWWGVRLLRWVLALSDRQLVLALFVVALLPRLLLIAVIPHDDVNLGELNNVAVSFAEQGYLGNPYGFQTGPSAHIAPGYATIVGLLIRAVGSRHVGFLLDRILTAIVAALLVALLPVIARRLGLSRLAGLLASLALIIPFFTWLETSGDWEAPYTAIALAAGLSAAWPSVSGGRLDVR
jgi:hypothetical protein